jgi:acyltransferase
MLGHTPIGPDVLKYTYIFNMPCFLFLSGYFFNLNKFSSYKEFVKSKAKAILLPYLGLSIVSIIFYKFYYNMPLNDTITLKNMLIVFFKATRNQIFYNIPLWFLPSLFFMENIFY